MQESSSNSSNYNPVDYWTERGKWYMPVFLSSRPNPKIELQERVLMQYLLVKEGIPKGRVLEVGAGFGRISKLILERFYENIDEYVLLDISKDQLANARMYLEKNLGAAVLEKVDVKYVQCDFMDFVNLENKFDLVLAVEVLMHVLLADIQKAIDVLVSLSSKNVLTIDWYENKKPEKEIAAHNTLFNYPRLYMNNPSVESFKRIPVRDKDDKKDLSEQSIFHVVKKKEKVFGWFMHSTTVIM